MSSKPKELYEKWVEICASCGWKVVDNPMFTHSRGDDYIAIGYDEKWFYIGTNHITHTYMTNMDHFYCKGNEQSCDAWETGVRKFIGHKDLQE
jgi:hypothetical protein